MYVGEAVIEQCINLKDATKFLPTNRAIERSIYYDQVDRIHSRPR